MTRGKTSESAITRYSRCVAIALIVVGAAGCGSSGPRAALEALRVEAIDAHLRFLAADQLQGRAPGSEGATLAAQYIATQFATAGLEPAVADTSYMQRFSLIAAQPSTRLAFRARGGASLRPRPGEEYVAWTTAPVDSTSAFGGVAFVGYGISAPELGWDDYKGADLTGAVLLILAGEPLTTDRFQRDTATVYGDWEYKLEEAWSHGAAAAFLVHMPYESEPAAPTIQAYGLGERLYLAGEASPPARIAGWIGRQSAEQIAAIAGLDFTTLIASAEAATFQPISSDVTATLSVVNRLLERSAVNVAGLIRGRDPARAAEHVVLTAHYDALGVGPPVEGDSIYNGAYDNASGVAVLLVLAEAFSDPSARPARSILVVASSASEAGSLGSSHYLTHPLRPLESTVAVLNLDGVNLWGTTRDVALVDGHWTDLGGLAQRAADDEDLILKRDWASSTRALFASDQIVFLRAGVPAALVAHGFDFVGRMPGWGREVVERFDAENRHAPGDEYGPEIDLAGAVQQGRFAFRLARLLTERDGRPSLVAGPGAVGAGAARAPRSD